MVMMLIACTASVCYMMALMQMPAYITAFFLTLWRNKKTIHILINVMLLVLGCLVDMAPSILIITPIVLPVVTKFGSSRHLLLNPAQSGNRPLSTPGRRDALRWGASARKR